MTTEVIILRGLPGAGKSTWIEEHYRHAHKVVVSADDFFYVGKEYRFDPRRIGEAHAACQRKFLAELQQGLRNARYGLPVATIVVDNTNVQRWELALYVDLAQHFGYEVREVVVGKLTPEACELYAARNVHGVPLAAIQAMAARWEP